MPLFKDLDTFVTQTQDGRLESVLACGKLANFAHLLLYDE